MEWIGFPDERLKVDGLWWFGETSPELWRLPGRLEGKVRPEVWELAFGRQDSVCQRYGRAGRAFPIRPGGVE